MKARVKFIMEVPENYLTAGGSEININFLATAVQAALPWNAKVIMVETVADKDTKGKDQ